MSGGAPRQLVVQAGAVAVRVSDILSIARSAGEAILAVYRTDIEVGQCLCHSALVGVDRSIEGQ